jgi:3-hydroxybutyryl-CoA dehydrogenase
MSIEIRQVGVIGAGIMGNGIAQVFAVAGYPVTMRDLETEYLDRGMVTISKRATRCTKYSTAKAARGSVQT